MHAGSPNATDMQVKNLLFHAGRSQDPRTFPSLGLLLSNTMSLGRISRLRWANWDAEGNSLIVARGQRPQAVIIVTQLLNRRIGMIPRTGSPFIFSPLAPTSPSLEVLIRQLLIRASMGASTVESFLGWSAAQSAAVRFSTVSD